MRRHFRVRDNERFLEVRRRGKSYSNRLAVLCILGNGLPYSRFGFSVSRRIGRAVVRNSVKRRMREAVRHSMPQIEPGWDCVFIARNPIRDAKYGRIDEACAQLLRRAALTTASGSQGGDGA